MENFDSNSIFSLLGKLDKKQLEQYMNQANEIMNSPDKDKIINELKKNL